METSRALNPAIATEVPTAALLGMAQAGDAAAFRCLVGRLRPRLYSFLLRMTRQPEVAEDLLQETLLRLVAQLGGFPRGTCVEAWTFTVARNLHVSWRRREALGLNKLLRLFDARAAAPSQPDPLASCELSGTQARLERALAALGRRTGRSSC